MPARDVGNDAARGAHRTGATRRPQAGEELAERASAISGKRSMSSRRVMADPSVDASRIDVDTDYETQTVTLNGSADETERDMAEVIAKARAEGYTVVNNLQVRKR